MKKHSNNPLITPAMIAPFHKDLVVKGSLNPGAIEFNDEILLLLRVAEGCKENGNEMVLTIRSTQNCYITIFNILEDKRILRLMPNQYRKNNKLTAGKVFIFPEKKDKKKGTLIAHIPEGKDTVTEMFLILALKHPFELCSSKIKEGIWGKYNGQTEFINDLIKEIVCIPLAERREQLIQYQINKE